jgi:tRNA (adenine22-N1)-methyltransferase
VLKAADTLVLQPMNDASGLRKWLYQHYWHIEDEELALADGRIYEIILARRGRRKRPSPLMLDIGPVLWEKKGELLQHHIEALLFQNRRIAAGMEKSERAKKSRKYKETLENIRALEERLKW